MLRHNTYGRSKDLFSDMIVADRYKITTVVYVFNHFTKKGVSGIEDLTVDDSKFMSNFLLFS